MSPIGTFSQWKLIPKFFQSKVESYQIFFFFNVIVGFLKDITHCKFSRTDMKINYFQDTQTFQQGEGQNYIIEIKQTSISPGMASSSEDLTMIFYMSFFISLYTVLYMHDPLHNILFM